MGYVALDPGFWRDRAVFVTGHTGFKGGWLVTWLIEMGAKVTGYALRPDTEPSYFNLCRLAQRMLSLEGDICDAPALQRAIRGAQPEVIFHLAAQPLVRRAFREPVKTFSTNVIGTVNILEGARTHNCVRAAVIVTSDKCYDLSGGVRDFKEGDPLGGEDPYSASKACAELVAAAYRQSFFHCETSLAIATVRAGNVIGGGDWAEDRLVPDAIRALCRAQPLILRNSHAVRPWQHVLEPLSGYLMLAQRLYEEGDKWVGSWNFGPRIADMIEVGQLADKIIETWGCGSWETAAQSEGLHEAPALRLDSTKAIEQLEWRPRLRIDKAVKMTVEWYRKVLQESSPDPYEVSRRQLAEYLETGILSARAFN